MGVLGKKLARRRSGRAGAASRGREIAAEVMGVAEAKGKTQAFAISSFYAGVGGAILASVVGRIIPETWDLFLSIEFVAIVLIGGAGTIAGVYLGTFFLIFTPRIVEEVTGWLAAQVADAGPFAWLGTRVIR